MIHNTGLTGNCGVLGQDIFSFSPLCGFGFLSISCCTVLCFPALALAPCCISRLCPCSCLPLPFSLQRPSLGCPTIHIYAKITTKARYCMASSSKGRYVLMEATIICCAASTSLLPFSQCTPWELLCYLSYSIFIPLNFMIVQL